MEEKKTATIKTQLNLKQGFFFCRHRHPETTLQVVESNAMGLGTGDPTLEFVYRCPRCKHTFIFRSSLSAMKQLMPHEEEARNYSKIKLMDGRDGHDEKT